MSAQPIQQSREPALHVVHAGSPRASLGVDAKRPLLRRAGREDGVIVADEQKPLRAGARLVADEVIAEALARDPAQGEAEPLQPLGEDGADAVDVHDVVGAAVVVHQARQELDLLVAPAVDPVQKVSHGRYGNVSASRRRIVQIGVDIGGTFTDIVALDARGRLTLAKVPSTPKDLLDGIAAATTTVLAQAGAKPADVERFIHGTTIATNAVLEQKGAVTAVMTTEGFEDVLELGRMKRSRMYDLAMDPETPTFVAPRRRRIGIRERLDARGAVLVPLDEEQVRAAVGALQRDGVQAIAVCYL